MANQKVLEYLRINRGNYKLEDLKKKILSSGYSQKDIDDVLTQLNTQSKGTVPTVDATIHKINKTNIPETNITTTVKPAEKKMVGQKPKKSKLKWLILSLIVLILIAAGVSVWYFWDKIIGLF